MSTPINPNPGEQPNNPNQWNTKPTSNPGDAQASQQAKPAAPKPAAPKPAAPKPAAPKAAGAKNIEWPVWFYGCAFLLSLLTSFLAVGRVKEANEYGFIKFAMNWWGSVSISSSGFGGFAEAMLAEEELSGGALYVITCLIVLGLLAAAAYFAWKGSEKQAGLSGLAAAAVQLLAVLVKLIDIIGTDGVHTGAGWWLWLLLGLGTLLISLQLFKNGRGAVEAKFNEARAAAGNRREAK